VLFRSGVANTADATNLPSEGDGIEDAHEQEHDDHLLALTGESFQALAAYADFPPAIVHRLAELLVMLFKAPTLVALGQAPLPRHIPWENLQILLHKASETSLVAKDIVAALRQRPFGTRLWQHLHLYLVDGDVSVTRDEVALAAANLLGVFDFVTGLLNCSMETEKEHRAEKVVANGVSLDGSSQPGRDQLIEAITRQEKEVARLRRQLREVERSEAAAKEFAATNAPVEAAGEARIGEEAASTALAQLPKEGNTKPEHVLAPSKEAKQQMLRQSELIQPEVTCCRQIQYRLNEVAVPPLQAAVLQSLENLILEPRTEDVRHLQLVGFAEIREESECAQQRADAVYEWFVARGMPPEVLSIETRPDSERGSRRVELRLVGESGDSRSVKQRAEALLNRVGIGRSAPVPDQTSGAAVASAAAKSTVLPTSDYPQQRLGAASAEAQQSPTGGSAGATSAPPCLVSLEEFPPADSTQRSLRLVFDLQGLSSSDVGLEVAEGVVRLVSTSDPWPEGDVNVPLPFPADLAAAGGAKFSRKAGTLTINLQEAASAA